MVSEENLKKRLFVNNYSQWADLASRKFLSDRKLEVREIAKGIILPAKEADNSTYKGGVCDSDMNFVAGFFRNKPPKAGQLGMKGAYHVDGLTKSDEEVIFGGVLIGLFGHFILECLGRMWYILKNRQDKRKIVFLLLPYTEEKDWFYSFFELLDIERDRIMILQEPTQFKKVIVPDESIHSWYDYTKEYLLPYDYIRNKVKDSGIKKLYLTRSKIKYNEDRKGMYLCNEEYLEQFYASKGYEIISPEQFSIEEQISMVAGADEIASTLGSLSHFALFCKPGTKFTMFTRVDDDTLYPQCMINEAKNLNWYIVDVSMNFLPLQNRIGGVCFLGETKFWRQYVKAVYNEEVTQETWKDKLKEYIAHWCYFFSLGSAAPLVMMVLNRTYELTKRNEIDI